MSLPPVEGALEPLSGYENGTPGASTLQIRIHKTGNSHELTWVGRDATAVFSASDLNDLHTGSD
jgi:hypothetical protein